MNINVLLPKVKFRSSHWRCSVKKGVPKNFVNFTGEHLWFNKAAGNQASNLLKETPSRVHSRKNYEIFKNTYFEEHLQTTASKNSL